MIMYENFLAEFNKAVLESGRDIEEIELIAVSKKKPLDAIRKVFDAGHLSFGENQIQEIESKWIDFKKENTNLILHYVGSIQSRKTSSILEHCDVIHSVDRLKVIKLIKEFENSTGIQRKYFLQINTGNEPQKSGILLDEAESFIEDCKNVHNFDVFGLMCLPPIDEDPSRHFNILRGLAKNHKLSSLSMGMSHDFKTAIKCGATHVRIGTSIFGERV
jgi:pyridoxal phosphate enzyme (YggS family)